jgi:hypothetical protein
MPNLGHGQGLAMKTLQLGFDVLFVAIEFGQIVFRDRLNDDLPVQIRLPGTVDLSLASRGNVIENLPLSVEYGPVDQERGVV